MNWLMYIGGGFVFTAVLLSLIGVRENADKRSNTYSLSTVVMKLVSVIMIWVWICWRFV